MKRLLILLPFLCATTAYSQKFSDNALLNEYVTVPTCSTLEAKNVTNNSALIGCSVTFTANDSTPTDLFFLYNKEGQTDSTKIPFHGNPIRYSGTYSLQLNELMANTNYYFRARVVDSNGSMESQVLSFRTRPAWPIFGLLTLNPNPVQYNNTLFITISIDNVNSGDQVSIEYGSYFQNAFITGPMGNSGLNNKWDATINADHVNENGLWFFIKVDQTANGGYIYRYPENNEPYMVPIPLTQNKIQTIKTSIGAFPYGLPPVGWNSYSLPFNLGAGKKIFLTEILGNKKFNSDTLPTNWDAYIVNDGIFTRTNELTHSSAYFIFHRERSGLYPDDSLHYWGISPAVSDFNINTMPVFSGGWQLMPWPYLKTATFTRKNDNGIHRCGRLWILVCDEWIAENDPRFNFTLKPYGAYAFYSKINNAKIDTFLEFTSASMLKAGKACREGEWEITMKAFDGYRYDRCNYIGAADHSADGLDPNDEYEPPAMGKAVSAYFTARENDKDIKLSANYQSVGQKGYAWDMVVENRGNRPMIELSWDLMNLPPGLMISMVDLNHHEIININSSEKYEFRAGKINPFKIYAGNSEFINQEIQKLKLPDKFSLYVNYPNPFNPGTTIRYDLKLGSTVTLSVYNALGQKIRTLIKNKAQTTGSYSAYWDGKDALGRQVASGVYICRIDVKDINGKTFRKSNKMMLLK